MDFDQFMHKFELLQKDLHVIWIHIGFTETERKQREKQTFNEMVQYLKSIKERETKIKKKWIKGIDEAGHKLHQLSIDLGIPLISEPEDGNTSLMELDKFLKEKLMTCEQEVQERSDVLKDLQMKEEELCKRLGEDPTPVSHNKVPSKETLEHIGRVVKTLENEAVCRKKMFDGLKASILCNMEELEMNPTVFESDILTDYDELINLSTAALNKMKSLSKELQDKVGLFKEEEMRLKDKIYTLWDFLSIDPERRNSLSEQLSTKAFKNIPILEGVLKELEELKHQNMGCLIHQLKRELEDWWEKCYISEDEKEAFLPYLSDEYSMEILEEHEKEIVRLKEFYGDNEHIFVKIQRWQVLWKKVTELGEKTCDPTRLFGNRGCALLQEEKERKRVNKELPRLEQEIAEAIAHSKKERGQSLLISGRSFSDYIKSQWEEYNYKKNLEKNKRQAAKNKQLELEARLGTTSILQKKRHLTFEHSQTPKYLRSNNSMRVQSGTSRQNLVVSPQRPRAQRPGKMATRSSHNDRTLFSNRHTTLSSAELSSYGKFTEEIQRLSERENIRSSVMPSSYLDRKSPMFITGKASRGVQKTPLNGSKKFSSPASLSRRPPFSPNYQASNYRPLTVTKVPSTLPKRRSVRLKNSSKSNLTISRNAHSPASTSQRSRFTPSKFSTPTKNRLNFLM